MKNLIKKVTLIPTLLILIAFVACKDDDNSTAQEVEAGFTYTVNQDTGKVTFINTSENASSYSWNFGDSTNSTEIEPIKTYVTGEYNVILTATNASGVSDTFEDTIYINIPVPVRLPITFDEANTLYNNVTTFPVGGTFTIVENPDLSGSNSTASMVAALTNNGVNWEGFFYDLDAPVDLSTDKTITMNVWSDQAVTVKLKLEEGSSAPIEVDVNHSGSGWEELIFTFSSAASYNRLTVFVDGPGTTAGTFYLDDIKQVPTIDNVAPVITLNGNSPMTVNEGSTFSDPGATATDNIDGDISGNIVVGGDTVDTNTVGTYTITYNVSDAAGNPATEVTRVVEVTALPTSPTVAAPTPTHPAANVISLFSDAYTDVAGSNLNPNWGQATVVTQEVIAGNNTLKYAGLNYQGLQIGSAQDVSGMTHLHIDYWTLNSTALNTYIISPGPVETASAMSVPTNGWASVDIPLTDFSPVDLANVIQMKFDGNGDIYLDNIYFYNQSTTGGSGSALFDFENGEAFTGTFDGGANGAIASNPDASGINTSANVYQFNKVQGSAWYSGMFHIFSADIDPSQGTTFKIKVWSPNANINFRFQLEKEGNQGPIVTYSVDKTLTQANTWVEMTFDFSTTGLNLADGYDKIVIFPDYDESNMVPVNPGVTYYIDDVVQE